MREKPKRSPQKPNILVIWGDDIGIQNLSCYSHGMMGYDTPNIDRLAKEGMMFTDSELNTIALPKRQESAYPVPLLPASFLAIRREVFQQVGGWDGGMRQSGADDLELCLRLWTSGFECFVVPRLAVAWMNPFAAGALRATDYWQDLLHNLLRLAIVHFSPERLGAFLACASAHAEYRAAAAALLSEELTHRQSQVRMSRCHSDDWFFNSFNG